MVEKNLTLLVDFEGEELKGISFVDENREELSELELEPGDEIGIDVLNAKDFTPAYEKVGLLTVKDSDFESGVESGYIKFEHMFRPMSGIYFYTVTKHPMSLYVTDKHGKVMDMLKINIANYEYGY
ncbi:hypothetical protein [Staphylococcus phage vB_StaM_SA1]|nr:hypothetical protein [Staphylococcus phage vB_StaM_SA1]